MIYRPIQNLRIGFAFHTPTYYWIDRTYQAYTDSRVHVNNPNDPDGLKPGRTATNIRTPSLPYWKIRAVTTGSSPRRPA